MRQGGGRPALNSLSAAKAQEVESVAGAVAVTGAVAAVQIQAEGLVKRYGGRTVVGGISLTVDRGQVVGLLGPNGAGKTTTFYMLVGLEQPDGGRVSIGDEDVTGWPIHRRARLGVGYLPQESSIFRKLTVEENLRAVLEVLPLSRAEQEERLEELLSGFGLTALRRQKGYMLSGGERRRTEIARALATRPSFLLLDEPFTGVDPIAVAELQELIRAIRREGIGVLVTDHNVRETLAICDRAYIVHSGRILLEGPPDQLVGDPEARRHYLGESFSL